MNLNWLNLHYDGAIYSKKNSKQIIRAGNRMMLVSNAKAKRNEQDMANVFCLQVMKSHWKPRGKYAVQMYIWRKDNVRRDLDNMATSVLDALVLAGALQDDNVNCVNELHVYDMGVDKDMPGVTVDLQGLVYEEEE